MEGDETFMLIENVEDINYEVYFFNSWSGYSHPVKLGYPVSYEESQSLNVYYKCLFGPTNKEVKLFRYLFQIILERDLIDPANLSVDAKSKGLHYYRIIPAQTLKVDREIKLSETLLLDQYLKIKLSEDAEIISCYLISKTKGYSYEYIYNENDSLRKAIIHGPEEQVIINY